MTVGREAASAAGRGGSHPQLRVVEGGRRAPRGEGTHDPAPVAPWRVFLCGLVALAVLLGAGCLQSLSAKVAFEAATADVVLVRHVVEPGETLWGIAVARPVEGLSTCDTVSYLSEENGIEDGGLVAGEVILVPAG